MDWVHDGAGYTRRKAATDERIMLATWAQVVARGETAVSISDVAAAAHVSRTTLYSRFPTKEALMEGLNRYVRVRYERELRAAVLGIDAPRERLVATLRFLAQFHESWVGERLIDLGDGTLVNGIRANFDGYCTLLEEILAPTFDALDVAVKGRCNRRLVVEILIRMHLSAAIVQLGQNWTILPESIETSWNLMMALTRTAEPPMRY